MTNGSTQEESRTSAQDCCEDEDMANDEEDKDEDEFF